MLEAAGRLVPELRVVAFQREALAHRAQELCDEAQLVGEGSVQQKVCRSLEALDIPGLTVQHSIPHGKGLFRAAAAGGGIPQGAAAQTDILGVDHPAAVDAVFLPQAGIDAVDVIPLHKAGELRVQGMDALHQAHAPLQVDGFCFIRPFGTDLLFACAELPDYTFGVELCEDLWVPCPPSTRLTAGGAAIIANLSASDEVIGKADYRRMLVSATSARLACGYIYCSASPTESTQDMVFSRHHLIAENGTILAENEPFADAELTITEIDVQRLMHERHRTTSYDAVPGLRQIVFHQPLRRTQLTRPIAPNPFVPPYDDQLRARAEAILRIQSQGLKKRIEHTHAKTVVLGISGGLDSTLALLVCVRAFDLCGRSRKQIQCVTMPCFGTTKRTKSNAVKLCEELGVSVQEVNITAAVRQHFADIGHDESVHDVTYENCQARERTQVLMDIANQSGGLVIGTGDLSELALGWATYNGDHMSMYAVNCSVPKTLVRYIVQYEAASSAPALQAVLLDILDTPVSPELLPADENGQIAQKTEDLVGPYELHDFFLYHTLRFGTRPRKLFRMAKYAYAGKYDDETIRHWLKTFCRRFFQQQFKRSCIPDGPKVGSVTLSPRGDWRMPSDASSHLWLSEAEAL